MGRVAWQATVQGLAEELEASEVTEHARTHKASQRLRGNEPACNAGATASIPGLG